MPRRPIAIDDLYAIRLVADPNISPDGRRVAFVVTTVDRGIDGYRSAIWMLDSGSGEEAFAFTSGTTQDSSPRWSPDGRFLAFLSDRGGTKQLWAIPGDGGEAWQVSSGPNPVSDISWGADSRTIAYVTKVEPRQSEKPQSDVRVIRTLKYKADGEGFLDGKRKHVHVIDIDGGQPRQVTDGDWDSTQPAFSPDGHLVAFVSNRGEQRESNTLSDIWLTDLRTGSTRCLTAGNGAFGTPAWSTDGSRLAFVGHEVVEPFGPTTLDDLFVHDIATGAMQRVLGALDREPGNSAIADSRYHVPTAFPIWDSDGTRIYTLVSNRGNVHIYDCAVGEEPTLVVGGTRDIQSFSVSAGGDIAFAASSMTSPTEVAVIRPGGEVVASSRINTATVDELEVPAPEEVTFPSDDGHAVHGWLLRPPARVHCAKYPAIVQVHGGPHGMYGAGFFHEMHVLAARGYIVLFTNPRGSTGYGQAFVAGSMGDWGGADYRDVMAGVAFLESLDDVDPERLGITGGSYGGYMTNWVITQTTRFKAAVTQRSTCNRAALYGTSDLNWSYNDWEFRGTPYANSAFYAERSPLTHVANVRTPLLILHSEADLRCPIEQGEQLFVALKKMGQEVEFVRFPDESHNLSRSGRPTHRVERLERLCAWFDTHL